MINIFNNKIINLIYVKIYHLDTFYTINNLFF